MISQMDALLDLGLDKFGYNFLTIDDFWQLPERDSVTGRMIEDPEKFPDGIKYLGCTAVQGDSPAPGSYPGPWGMRRLM